MWPLDGCFFILTAYKQIFQVGRYWRPVLDSLRSVLSCWPRNLPGSLHMDHGILGYATICQPSPTRKNHIIIFNTFYKSLQTFLSPPLKANSCYPLCHSWLKLKSKMIYIVINFVLKMMKMSWAFNSSSKRLFVVLTSASIVEMCNTLINVKICTGITCQPRSTKSI